jgi:hypothetical protein
MPSSDAAQGKLCLNSVPLRGCFAKAVETLAFKLGALTPRHRFAPGRQRPLSIAPVARSAPFARLHPQRYRQRHKHHPLQRRQRLAQRLQQQHREVSLRRLF